jgi:hypothetical protein
MATWKAIQQNLRRGGSQHPTYQISPNLPKTQLLHYLNQKRKSQSKTKISPILSKTRLLHYLNQNRKSLQICPNPGFFITSIKKENISKFA